MTVQKLQRISERILYMPSEHSTDRPILAAISGNDRTLIMDAGNSTSHAKLFLDQLAEYPLPKIELLMLTHWHWDHIMGMHHMNLPAIAHVETKRQIETMLHWNWSDEALDERVRLGFEIPFCADKIKAEHGENRDIQLTLPTVLFEQKLEIDLGGITCLIEHIGGDHAHDSCVLYVKEEKTLFLGDCLGPAIYCSARNYTSGLLLPLLEKLEAYDAEVFVPSHWQPITKREMATEIWEMRSLVHSTREHRGNKDEIKRDIAEKWGRELRTDDDSFIDYFIAGYDLETSKIDL